MEERDYRRLCGAADLIYYNVVIEQTDLYIATPHNMREEAEAFIYERRRELLAYIAANPFFEKSLAPMECSNQACEIVVRMCAASQKTGVGPMASVAGAFSQMLCEYLRKSADEVIIENGGDNCILTKKGRIARIFAGEKIGGFNIRIPGGDDIYAVCTSSGAFGHSFSFGSAEAVSIIASDAFLADAAATHICNNIREPKDIARGLEKAMDIDEVKGVVIVCGGKIGAAGEVEFVR